MPDPWGLRGEWKGPRVLRGGGRPTVQSDLVTAFDSEQKDWGDTVADLCPGCVAIFFHRTERSKQRDASLILANAKTSK